MRAHLLTTGLAVAALSCEAMGFEDGPASRCEIELEADYRPQQGAPKVFGGTVEPSLVPLAADQIPAVGSLDGACSGTLIAPRWVLTARHCPLWGGTAFCVGERHDNADLCTPSVRVVEHPVADIALVELAHEPAMLLPGLRPIPILTETMDCSWLGSMAEAAGYGRAPNLGFGTRFFTAEPIVAFSRELLTIDGLGRRGMCNGDSGGPVMVAASDGSARVAGTLQGGDASCRGLDHFSRIDTVRTWIESFAGPGAPLGLDRR